MNVRPTLPAAIASSASDVDRMANAVGRMAIPASSDATLLPTPIATALTTTSSSRRTYTAYASTSPQPAPVDHADCVSASSQVR